MRSKLNLPEGLLQRTEIRPYLLAGAELLLIVAWAIWVSRDMLDFDENLVPWGREYGMAVSTHHFWTMVKECGWCALWNGSQIGGYPALVNTYAGVFHPVTMIATLLWGVVNGSKVIVTVSLAVAGMAQWWVARELRLSLLPRMWSSLLVVVGGHLAGKLELGVVGLLLATASCSLVFGGVLRLVRLKDRKSVVLLATVLGLAVLSGQGYPQLALMTTIPALAFLLLDSHLNLSPVWRLFAGSLGLALLLTAFFLVPLVASSWNIEKSSDPNFAAIQPVRYSLLNFLIDDFDFYKSDLLSKWANPNLYINFVGWIPFLLAVLGLGAHSAGDRPKVLYLAGSATLVILAVDGPSLRKVAEILPTVANIRFPVFGLGMAVAPLLALGGYGLDQVLKRIRWPSMGLSFDREAGSRTLAIPVSLLLVIPLVVNVRLAYNFSRIFLTLRRMPPGVTANLDALRTPSLQWVQPVMGEQYWTEPAVRMGLKVTGESLPWWTGTKQFPPPYLELTRSPLPEGENTALVKTMENETLYEHPLSEYALVVSSGGQSMCTATGTAGAIDIECESKASGTLVVHENAWKGWRVLRDGQRAPLTGEQWLEVSAPPGKHRFEFRFLPIDVPIGVVLNLIGIGACGWILRPKSGVHRSVGFG